jgi:hypothetical protein
MSKLSFQNEFGEKYESTKTSQEISNALPAKAGVTAIGAITTPDATDEASAVTLANANKAKINAILAAMKVVS